jgi:signal transduction histidine kinase
MIPRLNIRLPLFELALLMVAVALGWAAFKTHQALNGGERPPVVEPPQGQESQAIQEILKLHALMEVKDRYVAVADQLEAGTAELREALQNFVRDKDRTEIGRYLRKSHAMESWLRRQGENRDPRKLQMLRDWLATLPEVPAASSNFFQVDIGPFLAQTDAAYSNYLAAVHLTEGQALTSDLVQTKLAAAVEPEKELRTLASHARAQAAAIDTFVERRPGELGRKSQTADDRGRSTAFIEDRRGFLQSLFYVLVLTVIVQCAVLIIALYGRIVVAPLRQKLFEDNTAIEHQRKLDHFAQLATGLAHEIRNPLTAISIRLFSLQKSLRKDSGEQGDAMLIRNEIDRLEQILKNFLKLARPTEPKFAVLTAEPALREVHDLLAPQLRRQAIDLNLASITDSRFHADPHQLKQVLINIIQNAADSIGHKGAITLRAVQNEVELGGQSLRAIILEVEDTGSGITPDVQERLFDPFFSTKENGTGLGLPIAAKIIDQHKGALDFETRLGRGTIFRVILPLASP